MCCLENERSFSILHYMAINGKLNGPCTKSLVVKLANLAVAIKLTRPLLEASNYRARFANGCQTQSPFDNFLLKTISACVWKK